MVDHDDDDGMSAEEMMLGATEESLREELDMASEVGELLLSPSRIKGAGQHDDDPPYLDLDDDNAGTNEAEIESSSAAVVSAIFCLLGVGTLLPWNAFISSEPYFHARLCSIVGDGGGIELLFGLCFNVCGFLSLIVVIATATGRTAAQSSSSGNYWQVLCALGLYLSLFAITTGAVLVDLDPTLFLVGTLLSLSVFGSCLAVAGTKIVGIAAVFPPHVAIAPFFAGQATGGAFIALTNFISATQESPKSFWEEHCRQNNSTAGHFVSDDNECPSYQPDMPTFWYFLLGSVILMFCIVGFIVLDRLPITQYYRQLASGEQDAINDLSRPLLSDESAPQHTPNPDTNEGERSSDASSVRSVLKAIKFPALAILITSFVTLSLFPAYTSTLQSVSICETKNRLQNDLFEPLSFILFNFPDLLSRIVAPVFIDIRSVQRRPHWLLVAAAARFIFPGLFLFAKNSSTDLPYVDSDFYSISVSMAFAFSNGVLMSLCFMVAPLLLPEDSTEMTRQRGSDLMNLNLACGLLGGSIASFIFSEMVTAL